MKTLKVVFGLLFVGLGIAAFATGVGPIIGIVVGGNIIMRALTSDDD